LCSLILCLPNIMRLLVLPVLIFLVIIAIAKGDEDWERSDYVKNRRSSPPPKVNAILPEDHRQARSISAVKAGQQAATSNKDNNQQSPSLLKIIKDAISSMG